MDYPTGFAQRFLRWADAFGGGWANADFDAGQIDFFSEYDRDSADGRSAPIGARLIVDDVGLAPFWEELAHEAKGSYPELLIEDAAMTMLAVDIDEFLSTNYSPAPRIFLIAEVLR
jgi:hypothetical protein